ncbi:MAG: PRD domain-containing protein [Turicibacter sp.]|nr:PRD domain-containing protein [Turicibacter sp.]
MRILQVINNNVVSVSKSGQELVLMGKGLGFKKKPGDKIDKNSVEKEFLLRDKADMAMLKQLLADIPYDCVELGQEVIAYAQTALGMTIKEGTLVSLADHIASAIQRKKEGYEVRNGLLHETKLTYRREYEAGIWALNLIKEKMGVELLPDEAAFIAIHLVNGANDQDLGTILKMTELIQSIYDIITDHFLMAFDEESLDFHRFFTHLKFFAQRLFAGKSIKDDDDFLYQAVKLKYPEAYICVAKINHFLAKTYDYETTKQESLYLMMHVARLVESSKP